MINFKEWLVNEEKNLGEAWWHGILPALSLATSQTPASPTTKQPEYIYGAKAGEEEGRPKTPEQLKRYKNIDKLTDMYAKKLTNKLAFHPDVIKQSEKSRKEILDSLDIAAKETIKKQEQSLKRFQTELIKAKNADDAQLSRERIEGTEHNIRNVENWLPNIKKKISEMENLDNDIWNKLQTISDLTTDKKGKPAINQRLVPEDYEQSPVIKFLITLMNKNVDKTEWWKAEFGPALSFSVNDFNTGIIVDDNILGAKCIFSEADMRQIVEDITMLYENAIADMQAKKLN